jgi:hypothetical protein
MAHGTSLISFQVIWVPFFGKSSSIPETKFCGTGISDSIKQKGKRVHEPNQGLPN